MSEKKRNRTRWIVGDLVYECGFYYSLGASKREVAELMGGGSVTPIHNALKELGMKRTQEEAAYLSGKFRSRAGKINKRGYIKVPLHRDSPYYSMASYNRVLEHRLVMAKHLGRNLEKWEVVHHINHIRHDNRIENLELISSQIKHHAETIAHNEFMRMKKKMNGLDDLVDDIKSSALDVVDKISKFKRGKR